MVFSETEPWSPSCAPGSLYCSGARVSRAGRIRNAQTFHLYRPIWKQKDRRGRVRLLCKPVIDVRVKARNQRFQTALRPLAGTPEQMVRRRERRPGRKLGQHNVRHGRWGERFAHHRVAHRHDAIVAMYHCIVQDGKFHRTGLALNHTARHFFQADRLVAPRRQRFGVARGRREPGRAPDLARRTADVEPGERCCIKIILSARRRWKAIGANAP